MLKKTSTPEKKRVITSYLIGSADMKPDNRRVVFRSTECLHGVLDGIQHRLSLKPHKVGQEMTCKPGMRGSVEVC